MRCDYCFQSDASHKVSKTLTQNQIRHLIDLSLKEYPTLHVIWHGGEPTLLPISFYEEIMKDYPNITWSLQTNGTRLDDQWLNFIKTYSIHTSVSFDYDKLSGRLYNDVALRALQTSEAQPISVLTRFSIYNAIEMYEKAKQLTPNKTLCFNLAYDTEYSKPSIKSDQFQLYADFLKYILSDTDENAMLERNLLNFLLSMGGQPPNICILDCQFNWLTLEADGYLYPCDRLNTPISRLIHIDDLKSINDAFANYVYESHYKKRVQQSVRCGNCKYSSYCFDRCTLNHQNPNHCNLLRYTIKSLMEFLVEHQIQNKAFKSIINIK